jgi:hypothetical protein
MTAEIAILNRSAVALAADSALTISVSGIEKIYNTAEKIFEVSRKSPIGLLVYNNMDFMGFPWDVLVRRFRKERDNKFLTVKDVADEFIKYIGTLPISTTDENDRLWLVLVEVFDLLYQNYRDEATNIFANSSQARAPFDGPKLFHDQVEKYVNIFTEEDGEQFFSEETEESFLTRYGSVCESAINYVMPRLPLGQTEKKELKTLAFRIAKSRVTADAGLGFGNFFSGLVFVGYAESDFFPSIYSVVIDGHLFGQTKYWCTLEANIDRQSQRAVIEPFAQREMVDRFVFGLDKDTEADLASHIEKSSKTMIEKILGFLNSGRVRALKMPADLIDALANEARRDFTDNFLKDIKSLNLKETYEIVTAMPKAELAQMAEALVSLTSTKRRTSLGSETVGGPVDVAVITKGEGFVWIKRKHYFDTERNPGFVARHYGDEMGERK